MFGIVKDLHLEPISLFRSGDYGLGLILFLILLCMWVITIWLLVFLIDTVGVEPIAYSGEIGSLHHNSGYMQTTTVGSVTTTTYIPDSWSAYVMVSEIDSSVSCSISNREYIELRKGKVIDLYVAAGRLSENYYCAAIVR